MKKFDITYLFGYTRLRQLQVLKKSHKTMKIAIIASIKQFKVFLFVSPKIDLTYLHN